MSKRRFFQDWTIEDVRRLVDDCDSQRAAARVLGVAESTLRTWLKNGGGKELLDPRESRQRKFDPVDPICRSYLVRRLNRWVSIASLADDLDCAPSEIEGAIQHLREAGYQIVNRGTSVKISKEGILGRQVVDLAPIKGREWSFGVVSDKHLCNRHQRLDVLEAAYDEFARRKITDVFDCGNMVDGEFKFNRFELEAHGMTDQTQYVIDHHPQRSGITTHFITGDCHEGWWRSRVGVDWGKWLEYEAKSRGRYDFNYLGYMDVDVAVRNKEGKSDYIKVFHPGGGTAYALSYSTQKIVESLQGGEKPGLLLCGHYHKAIYHMVRNVHVIQCGTACDQTSYMRKKKIEAHVGFWVITIQQDANGAIRKIVPEWYAYYDRGYNIGASL